MSGIFGGLRSVIAGNDARIVIDDVRETRTMTNGQNLYIRKARPVVCVAQKRHYIY
jgi:hypothetical protein